ncbi:hypothetical protein F383_12756 [Gossypium arboreum]|uniref:Uncharacterized protein n=1 Tax=Gossypium arboreum TaxID=29729 RepID=A0A0B0NCX5_GOSAR|nr:hypothetical protein F383_12756 [Gossypium arboreum]
MQLKSQLSMPKRHTCSVDNSYKKIFPLSALIFNSLLI